MMQTIINKFQFMFKLNERYWLPLSIFIFVLISTLSLTPLTQLPSVPGSDKTHHFIAYSALIFPAALYQHRHLAVIALFYFTCSALIEVIQPFVNRYGEWLDLAANTGGLLTGYMFAQIICYFYSRSKGINN